MPASPAPAEGERLYSRWDFKHLLADGYVDIIQPDLSQREKGYLLSMNAGHDKSDSIRGRYPEIWGKLGKVAV